MSITAEELAQALAGTPLFNNLSTTLERLNSTMEDCVCKEAERKVQEAETATDPTPPPTATPTPPADVVVENEKIEASAEKAAKATSNLGDAVLSSLNKVGGFAGTIKKAYVQAEEAIESATGMIRQLYDDIQDDFGNIRYENFPISDFARATKDTTVGLLKTLTDLSTKSLDLASKTTVNITGQAQDSLQFLYGVGSDGQEALKQDFISFLGAGKAETSKFFTNLSQQQVSTSLSIGKALNISTQQQAELVELQLQRTGKVGTDLIEEVGAYAIKIQEATGVSSKLVAQGIIALQKDMETFGDIGTDQAARIMGALTNLGVQMQSFSGMVSKFMNFDTAVSSISDLTSAFGLQLDAMEMFRLANEDEEEMLRRVREEIQAQGLSVDDLNKQQLNLLKTSLGFSDVADVRNYLREGTDADFDALTEATDDVDIGSAFEDIVAQGKPAKQTLEDINEAMQAQAMLKGEEDAIRLANGFQQVAVSAGNAMGKMQPIFDKLQSEALQLGEMGISAVNAAIDGDLQGSAKIMQDYVTKQKDTILNFGKEIGSYLGKGISADNQLQSAITGQIGDPAQVSTIAGDLNKMESPSLLGRYIFAGITHPDLIKTYQEFMSNVSMAGFETVSNLYDTDFYPMIDTKFKDFQMSLIEQINAKEVDFLATLIDDSLQTSVSSVTESLQKVQTDIVANSIESVGFDVTETTDSVVAASDTLKDTIDELTQKSKENIDYQKRIADNGDLLLASFNEIVNQFTQLNVNLSEKEPITIQSDINLNVDGKQMAAAVVEHSYNPGTGETILIRQEEDISG